MAKRLDALLQPQVAAYLMERLGRDLNALDVSQKLSDWQAEPSPDGGTVHVTATVKFDVPMTRFRALVADAARREVEGS